MERKTTELEQKLLKNGFELTQKKYTGKHSERIASYLYTKGCLFVVLTPKRNEIIDYGVIPLNNVLLIGKELKENLDREFNALEMFLFYEEWENAEEIVETVESVEKE